MYFCALFFVYLVGIAPSPVVANDDDNGSLSSTLKAPIKYTESKRDLNEFPPRIPSPSKHLDGTNTRGRRKLTSLTLQDLTTLTANDLVDTLIGGSSNLVISNVAYTGVNIAAGAFSTTDPTVIGFNSGVVLTSGSVANVQGPNNSGGTSQNNGQPGDADLNQIATGQTRDAATLQFDFECLGLTEVSVDYVFMSEEYNEFVNSAFNDAFAFFLNGQNIALLPDLSNVGIDQVNCGTSGTNPSGPNCNLFIDNTNNIKDTEMDGLTTALTASGSATSGVNTIKLTIADVGDSVFDSAVLLKGGSFVCLSESEAPSAVPSEEPSIAPSAFPSTEPSIAPSAVPSAEPSIAPSVVPSAEPSTAPSAVPSSSPTPKPTFYSQGKGYIGNYEFGDHLLSPYENYLEEAMNYNAFGKGFRYRNLRHSEEDEN